jgi:hypothetical protein
MSMPRESIGSVADRVARADVVLVFVCLRFPPLNLAVLANILRWAWLWR